MSISKKQTEQVLEHIVREVYSEGRNPPLGEITRRLAKHFAKNPAGSPLPFPQFQEGKSDPAIYNDMLNALGVNVGILYDVALEQIEAIMQLSSSLQSDLQRLTSRRRRVESKIDDYLLTLYDTDGYYYSISDTFSDTTQIDMSLTSAQIDPVVGAVMLPAISSLTQRIPPNQVSNPSIRIQSTGRSTTRTLAPFSGAIEDGIDNMVWAFEVEVDKPQEVVAFTSMAIGNGSDPVNVSRVDFTPYGVSPIQVFVESSLFGDPFTNLGGSIQTSANKMSFGNGVREASVVRLTLRKTTPDYSHVVNGQMRYRYIFGARDISLYEQAYDYSASFVSTPLSLPEDFDDENVIDAVSLTIDEEIPAGTSVHYYVAADDPNATSLDDFTWHDIIAIDSDEDGDKIVRFEGAGYEQVRIYPNAKPPHIPQILLTNTGPIANRNPSPIIIPGVDVYRIAEFTKENALLNSLQLHEGINTSKIYSVPLNAEALDDLQFWADLIKSDDPTLQLHYGEIETTAAQFFYGGDVGVAGRSVYVETYLDSPQDRDAFLAEMQKVDSRSREWNVKVFLNGRELGFLPKGVDRLRLPWSFNQGLNHIALVINIPSSGLVNNIYNGSINLLGTTPLHRYGDVYLAKWDYTDFFNMQYNERGQPTTFTIHNGEIISRRKPTKNFRLKYATVTGNAPSAVRIRADLDRDIDNSSVTPQIRSYRLRFSYGLGF